MFRSHALYHFIRRLIILSCLLLTLLIAGSIELVTTAFAQTPLSPDRIWSATEQGRIAPQGERVIIPTQYRTVRLNGEALQQLLQTTPLESSATAPGAAVIFALPLPDGRFERFQIAEYPVMAPELAAQFPAIKTFAGQGLDDPTATVRFDWTPAGFHAMILSANETVYIDPYSRNDTTNYISYFKHDFQPPADKVFNEVAALAADAQRAQTIAGLVASNRQQAVGNQLRTYRLAIAANGEYTQFHGGTVANALAAIVTTVNRINGIYEREVAVRLVLVANNNLIIYTNPETDPYTNNNASLLLDENQATLDAVIGDHNYDVGHVFTTGGGGLASLGTPCLSAAKARGVTGSTAPVGDPFDVDYVAHELGHQFGGYHTFNNDSHGSCIGNRNGETAYEPGSGTTIMAYAGICDPDNLQLHSDPYFSTISFDEIIAYTTIGDGNSCPVITNTGNAAPVVNAGAGGFTIPRQTPFTLTGSATDANGDALTYSWEEFDLGAPSVANNPNNPPFFRFFPPTTSRSRTFPKWSDIVNNTTTIGEILPNVTRTLNFRLTARDNKLGGGGVSYARVSFNVTTAAGPFLVTAPNTAVTWAGGSTQNVTWNVANTNLAPVNCANVKLLLSTDGGFTYPTTLATSVPNNGSANVTVPNLATTTARVQVACATNIFFDISNTNFTITQSEPTITPVNPPTNTPVDTPADTPTPVNTPTSEACAPAAKNVVQNGSFEGDKDRWGFYTNSSGNFGIGDPAADCTKAARLQIGQSASNIQLYQQGIVLQANTRYQLNFAAYATSGNDLGIYLQNHDSPYEGYGLSVGQVPLSDQWQRFTFEFTTSGFNGVAPNARLRFWLSPFAQAGDVYWIDDIRLLKVADIVPTATPTPTNTPIVPTATPTNTPVNTPVNTPTQTPINTPVNTPVNTPAHTPAPGDTPTPANTPTSEACVSVNGNSVQNGSFEGGQDRWHFYTGSSGNFSIGAPAANCTKAARLQIDQSASNIQLYQRSIPLEANTRYQLSFAAYATSGNDLGVYLQNHRLPYENYGLTVGQVPLSDQWQLFIFEFTSSGFDGVAPNARLRFWLSPFAQAGDVYWIDDIRLVKVAGNTPVPTATPTGPTPTPTITPTSEPCVAVTNNLFTNGNMENGTNSWSFYTNSHNTFSTGTPAYECANAAQLQMHDDGTNIQLYQSGLRLEANTRYRLRFAASSSTGADLAIYLHNHMAPYHSYGLAVDQVNLGKNWQLYTVDFTTSGFVGVVNNARLRFWLAPFSQVGDTYWIDAVSLVKLTDAMLATLPEASAPPVIQISSGFLIGLTEVEFDPMLLGTIADGNDVGEAANRLFLPVVLR